MFQTHLTALYGAGIMMLLTVQVLVACGVEKREICSLSTIGIAPCLVAASALGNWKLFAISLCWLIICAWGSPIIERRAKPGISDKIALFVAFVPLMIWVAQPSYLLWASVGAVQTVWMFFAWGLACRPIYLLSITAASLPILPSLFVPTSTIIMGLGAFWFGASAFILLWVYVAAARTRSQARPLW